MLIHGMVRDANQYITGWETSADSDLVPRLYYPSLLST